MSNSAETASCVEIIYTPHDDTRSSGQSRYLEINLNSTLKTTWYVDTNKILHTTISYITISHSMVAMECVKGKIQWLGVSCVERRQKEQPAMLRPPALVHTSQRGVFSLYLREITAKMFWKIVFSFSAEFLKSSGPNDERKKEGCFGHMVIRGRASVLYRLFYPSVGGELLEDRAREVDGWSTATREAEPDLQFHQSAFANRPGHFHICISEYLCAANYPFCLFTLRNRKVSVVGLSLVYFTSRILKTHLSNVYVKNI